MRKFSRSEFCLCTALLLAGTARSGASDAPAGVSITPASVTSPAGVAQVFTGVYSDPKGASNLEELTLRVGDMNSQALYAKYNAISKQLFLLDTAGNVYLGGFAPGSSRMITNESGSLDCAGTSVWVQNNTLTIQWRFLPAAGFAGKHGVYLFARNRQGVESVFNKLGNWMVTAQPLCLHFDGQTGYIEVPDSDDFSPANHPITVAVWIRPDATAFPHPQDSPDSCVQWAGKGDPGAREWALRTYSLPNAQNRGNRTSVYAFNPKGGEGDGSFYQDPMTPGEWICVTAVITRDYTRIYKNGVRRSSNWHSSAPTPPGFNPPYVVVTPHHGPSPLRLGTEDLESWWLGSMSRFRIWTRELSQSEIVQLYQVDAAPRAGLALEYLFTNNTNRTAVDSSGKAHNGVIIGGALFQPGNP